MDTENKYLKQTEEENVRKLPFNQLNVLSAGDKIEKKNGLSYASWAYAWQILKTKYPRSYYTIYENERGWNYFTDGKTCWVKTGVTLVDTNTNFELEHIEYLPIMDFRNKSIPCDNVTSMDVNKAIQRSLTKAAARHGVFLYIYQGEDLPEENVDITILNAQIDANIKRITADMNNDQKTVFAKDVILPIIGKVNYKLCKEEDRLAKLNEILTDYDKK